MGASPTHAPQPLQTRPSSDGSTPGSQCHPLHRQGLEVEVVKRSDDVSGFKVMPKRWEDRVDSFPGRKLVREQGAKGSQNAELAM